MRKGVPEHLRSDHEPEFVAHDLRKWLADTGAKTAYIKPGSPWKNGYCESFHSKMRDKFLNGEIFYSMKELRVLAECWCKHYNTIQPHSLLRYRPPARETWPAPTSRQVEETFASLTPPPPAKSGIDPIPEIPALHERNYYYKTSARPLQLSMQHTHCR